MKGFQIIVEGNWGHFKKPETNNNPLSHDLITKTALIGMIGAVIGKERVEMKSLFPQLSEDILYGVQLCNAVKKVSWGFTSKTAINPTAEGSPKYFEFLKNPKFKIILALHNIRSESIFEDFKQHIQNSESIYQPILGWHNCPANLEWFSEGEVSKKDDDTFETSGFVIAGEHIPKDISGSFRMGFDRLPTHQDEDMWNLPDKYKQIIYPDYPHKIKVQGRHFEYSNKELKENWCLI